ncbi:hypothetical protein M8818_002217 [Zalaria obscura]|uniref:Uncharacterized protein n=1 Tax=Zalaria obscura TaxID=2024903 RepID=A0ACC3SJ53_9PEZI
MADTMDIDMDIDLTEDPEMARLEAEAMQNAEQQQHQTLQTTTTSTNEPQTQIPAAYTDDADATIPAPTKIHLRGLDNLTTQDIQAFGTEYGPTSDFRVEWIDDTSANLVYRSAPLASSALSQLSFSDAAMLPELELRAAKQHPTIPNAELMVRQATLGDVKPARAYERSRFYLMNPGHDPRERRGRYDGRGRGGGRGGDGRRRYDDAEDRRRREKPTTFDEGMYDDEPSAQPAALSRKDSPEEGEERGRRRDPRDRGRDRRGDDLFAGKERGRLGRDRSASPLRDGDGRFGFEDAGVRRRTARQRSGTPPRRRGERELLRTDSAANTPNELFPTKPGKASALDATDGSGSGGFGNGDGNGTELLGQRRRSSPSKRELFPHRTERSNHRRSDALDKKESKEIFVKGAGVADLASRITGGPSSRTNTNTTNDLASRISGGPQANGNNAGFSIRGAGEAELGGYNIRGASKEAHPVVKELFPLKTGGNGGNAAKELFGEKIKGRGGRRRAEDLF